MNKIKHKSAIHSRNVSKRAGDGDVHEFLGLAEPTGTGSRVETQMVRKERRLSNRDENAALLRHK